MSAKMKFIWRTVNYSWQDYKTDDDILSELKINPVAKKMQNYRINGYNVFREWAENISFVGKEVKDNPSKNFPTVNGTGTVHEA
jgi:hypothetical protein